MADRAHVEIEGLRQFRRTLKYLEGTAIERDLRGELRDIAQEEARVVQGRVGARSFSYRGVATAGLKAAIRTTGPKAFVGRFREFGFHPRGSSTFVAGRNEVGRVLERDEDRILRRVGDVFEDAARKAGWR